MKGNKEKENIKKKKKEKEKKKKKSKIMSNIRRKLLKFQKK